MAGIRSSEFSPKTVGVLIAAAVTVLFSPLSLLSIFTLFMQPMSRDLHWNRTQISFPLTLLGLGTAIMSPVIGKAVDTWGPRRVVLLFSVLFACAVASLSIVRPVRWQIYALFALVGGVNAGMIPSGRLIADWFERQRGLAYGLFGLGIIGLKPVLLQITRPLIDAVGWRGAYLTFGIAVLVISVPTALAGFRERHSKGRSQVSLELIGSSLQETRGSRAYWLIVASVVLSVFVFSGVMTHGVAMLTERGLSRAMATTVLSALPIGAIISRPLSGYLVDRFDSPLVVTPFAIIALAGLFLVRYLNQPIPLIAASALLGLGVNGESSTTQYWVTRYFGLRHFSLIYGSIQPMTWVLAVACGPLLLGSVYDHTGSYSVDFLLMEIALAVATICVALLGPYVYSSLGSHMESRSPSPEFPATAIAEN